MENTYLGGKTDKEYYKKLDSEIQGYIIGMEILKENKQKVDKLVEKLNQFK